MLEASSYPPVMTHHNPVLFPLPLSVYPITHRSSGHRRRRHQRASALHAIANSMIRGLNTLFLNYPAENTARNTHSADPSAAQSRLTDSLLNAAAAYYNASRQCFDSAALDIEGRKSLSVASGGVTLIPGCSLLQHVPRPRVQALQSIPGSNQGLSLFIFDRSTLSPCDSNMDSFPIDMPDTYAMDYGKLFHLFDSVPVQSVSQTESAFYSCTIIPKGLVPLVADQVALPSGLNNVPLLSLLPQSVASLYHNSSSLLLSPPLAQHYLREARLRKPRVLALRREYVALISRMALLGMLSMTTTPACVNGLFGVPKGDKIRLILDARPANCYFVRPPRVRLPSPSHLAALRIPHGRPLYVSKMDLSNFYHQLTLPEWIRPFFALPALTVDEVRGLSTVGLSANLSHALSLGVPLYPCCATLPMGFAHSVFLAQSVHEHVLYRDEALRPSDNVTCLVSPWIDRSLHALYVDDNIGLGTNLEELTLQEDRVHKAYDRALLPPNDKKCVKATLDSVTVLGVDIDGRRGVITLNPDKLRTIFTATEKLLAKRSVKGRELSALVGTWTWPMLLRRPTLAVFKHVYTFAQRYRDSRQILWPCVRRELLVVMALAPLLQCDLRRQAWSKLIASDASMIGSGVVSTPLDVSLELSLWPLMTQPDCTLIPINPQMDLSTQSELMPAWPMLQAQQPVELYRTTSINAQSIRQGVVNLLTSPSVHWSTAIASAWRRSQHINELELLSLLLSLRWVLSHPNSINRQLHVLVDSSSVYFGVNKGRSSSPRMLALLRRFAALTLASGVSVLTGWVPSALNPADHASRKYVKRRLSRPND
jgi:hypothetical protein